MLCTQSMQGDSDPDVLLIGTKKLVRKDWFSVKRNGKEGKTTVKIPTNKSITKSLIKKGPYLDRSRFFLPRTMKQRKLEKSKASLLGCAGDILKHIATFLDFESLAQLIWIQKQDGCLNTVLHGSLKPAFLSYLLLQVKEEDEASKPLQDWIKKNVVDTKSIDSNRMQTFSNLVLNFGCQVCGNKPRTRKVYWQFEVRICVDCLSAKTIADYRLKKLNIEKSIVKDLPFMSRKAFPKFPHNFLTGTVCFYLRRDANKRLKELEEESIEEREKRLPPKKLAGW